MPPVYPVRKRTDSHGSGTDSQENESQPDMYDRDPRTWVYGPPHGPQHGKSILF